jgi:hypothetical protein
MPRDGAYRRVSPIAWKYVFRRRVDCLRDVLYRLVATRWVAVPLRTVLAKTTRCVRRLQAVSNARRVGVGLAIA